MDSHRALLEKLVEHCLGGANPSAALLSEGKLPKNWTSQYLALLERASSVWEDGESWPRELVGCLHFVSQLLTLRYEVWSGTYDARSTNTERQLAAVRGASALFLISGVAGREVGDLELEQATETSQA